MCHKHLYTSYYASVILASMVLNLQHDGQRNINWYCQNTAALPAVTPKMCSAASLMVRGRPPGDALKLRDALMVLCIAQSGCAGLARSAPLFKGPCSFDMFFSASDASSLSANLSHSFNVSEFFLAATRIIRPPSDNIQRCSPKGGSSPPTKKPISWLGSKSGAPSWWFQSFQVPILVWTAIQLLLNRFSLPKRLIWYACMLSAFTSIYHPDVWSQPWCRLMDIPP